MTPLIAAPNTATRNGYAVAAAYDVGQYTCLISDTVGKQNSDVANNDADYAKAYKR